MVVIKGYKIRLLPTVEQEVLIKKSVGVSRFIYNWCLDRQLKSDSFIKDSEVKQGYNSVKENK